MPHYTLIFHYPPERNRINYLRKKKFNNVLHVPQFFKSTVSSNLLNRCERNTCSTSSYLNDFVAENATTVTVNCCKLEWLVNQWLALILVFRDEVRAHLNHKAAIHKAKQLGCPPMVFVAQDTCKDKSLEDQVLTRKMLELSNSKTEYLPGLLPFVPGMPVILTQNIAIDLGLINGVNGIFRQLVYIRQILQQQTVYRKYIQATRYTFIDLCALIEIPRSKIECNMGELPPQLVPIRLIEQTFRVDIGNILPEDKRMGSNHKALLSVERRALPLVPAYCITTHKSQGQTFSKVVINLKLSNETDDIAAVYVPLSRVKRLADLVILRHFDYKVLLIKPSKSQVAEMERLDKLYLETQTRFAE